MKEAVIVSGGNIRDDFALSFLKKITDHSSGARVLLIAADRGLEFLEKAKLQPDIVVGDFDSISSSGNQYLEKLSQTDCKICRLKPEKDDSDTQSALMQAVWQGAETVYLLGATGGRLDHFLANLGLLSLGERLGIQVILADEKNCISLIKSGTVLLREEQFGNYVSFFPVGGDVHGLTLEGFAYPLRSHHLTVEDSGLTLSNEIAAPEARVTYDSGRLLMIMSRD